MTYILLIWTVISCSGSYCKYDWRPLGEFHTSSQNNGLSFNSTVITAEQRCQDAAQQLALKTNEYRCVRSK